jgi:hypothetical protein
LDDPCFECVEAGFCCRTHYELSRCVGVDDVGLESAVDYLTLDDVPWLGLLAQYGDCVIGCDECVEGVDLAKSVRLIGKMRRSEYHTPSQGLAAACASLPKYSTFIPA